MNLVVIGYKTCKYYIDIQQTLNDNNINYISIVAKDHQDLMCKVYEIGFNRKLVGKYGFTSPQVFLKMNDNVLWCFNGHDDTIEFGVQNIKEIINKSKKNKPIKY